MISLDDVVAVETNASVELYLVISKEDNKTKFSGLYLRSPKEVKLHTKEAKTMDRLKKGLSKHIVMDWVYDMPYNMIIMKIDASEIKSVDDRHPYRYHSKWEIIWVPPFEI